eukprot:COSAG01_NODE_1281_length_10920_cov_39.473480_3_plen_846_part_00
MTATGISLMHAGPNRTAFGTGIDHTARRSSLVAAMLLLPPALVVLLLRQGHVVHAAAGTRGDPRVTPSSPSVVSIVWASSPVLPGETALLQIVRQKHNVAAGSSGCPASSSATVCTVSAPTTKAVCVQASAHSNDTALWFGIPPHLPLSRYRVSVCGASAELNAPDPWWVQGDRGVDASSAGGGEIRVAGRSLAFWRGACVQASAPVATASTTRVRLVPVARERAATAPPLSTLSAEVVSATCYDLVAILPPRSVSTGAYTVEVRNSLSGDASDGWATAGVIKLSENFWFPNKTWHLHSGNNLTAVLEQARATGGGTITLAHGTTFAAPTHTPMVVAHATRLVAASDTSASNARPRIVWSGAVRPYNSDDANHEPLLSTRGTFEVRGIDLVLQGDAAYAGVPVIAIADGSKGGIIADVQVKHERPQITRQRNNRVSNALYIGNASGFTVQDCDFTTRGLPRDTTSNQTAADSVCGLEWTHQNILHLQHASWGRILSSNFSSVCSGWSAASSRSLIFDGNQFVGTGMAQTGGSGMNALGAWRGEQPSGVQLAFVRNRVIENAGASVRSETFTTDAGMSGYYGTTGGSTKNRVSLLRPLTTFHGTSWVTATFAVVAGLGKGQVGEVSRTNYTSDGLELELVAPLEVMLDDSSVVTVAPNCGRGILAGNSYINGTNLQLYGATNYVIADNHLLHMFGSQKIPGGGIRARGLVYDPSADMISAHLPLMRVEIRGNLLNGTNGIDVEGCLSPHDGCHLPFAICDPSCVPGVDLAQAIVVRGNAVHDTHTCSIQLSIRDACKTRISDCHCEGIALQEKLLGVVLDGNELHGNSTTVISSKATGVYCHHCFE